MGKIGEGSEKEIITYDVSNSHDSNTNQLLGTKYLWPQHFQLGSIFIIRYWEVEFLTVDLDKHIQATVCVLHPRLFIPFPLLLFWSS